MASSEDSGPTPSRIDVYLPDLDGKEVMAMVMDYDVPKRERYGRRQVYIKFTLLEVGQHSGTSAWGVCTYYEKPGPASKYYQWWCIANEGKPTGRNTMTPRRFKGSVFRVRLKTVAKDSEGDERPDATKYTKVTKILWLEARGAKSR